VPVLQALGLDDVAERVYRELLKDPECSTAELASRCDITAARARRCLDLLLELGLATKSRTVRHSVVPSDPRIAVAQLVRSRRAELDEAASTGEELADYFREGRLRGDPMRLVEVVEGAVNVARRAVEIVEGAQRAIMVLNTPPYVTPTQSQTSGGSESALMSRGVRIRVIYSAEALEIPGYLDMITADVAAGEEARLLRSLPLKLVVVDQSTAMLPLTATDSGTESSAVIVQPSRLVDALSSLFEALWLQASPLFGAAVPADRRTTPPADSVYLLPPTPEEQQLLELLHAGLKDEVLARRLGISERTLRRRVVTLLDRLGAGGRFQGGAQAVRRGWL